MAVQYTQSRKYPPLKILSKQSMKMKKANLFLQRISPLPLLLSPKINLLKSNKIIFHSSKKSPQADYYIVP